MALNFSLKGNLLVKEKKKKKRRRLLGKGWNSLGGSREVQEGVDICIPMADSC